MDNNCSIKQNSVKHGQTQPGKTQLNILTLNVCGLNSKLQIPEFISLIQNHDIICLQETKLDDTDTFIELPGYKVFCHNRECISRYRSGGIALCVKDELLPYVKIDQTKNSKLILFFTISHEIYKSENQNEDLTCGIVYIPPQGSKYSSDDPYLEIQQELFRYCLDSKHVLLMGDFNSRVKNLPDFVQIDKYMCDVYGLHDLYEENTNILNILEVNNISLNRHSADNSVNSYGYNLLEFCKNNNIFILNGRFENDLSQPSLTCKNSSTVDYFLSTANVMPNVDTLNVCEFSSLFSDAHCPVALTLNTKCNNEPNRTENSRTEQIPRLWDSEKCDSFIDNIDILKVSEIEMHLDQIMNAENGASKADIDGIVLQIGSLFSTTSKTTFGTKTFRTDQKSKSKSKKNNFKPWFNGQCFQARNLYHKSRKMYNKYKTKYYRTILKTVSKNYKRTLTINNKRYTNDKIDKLRSLKTNNPREYWKIINSHKKSTEAQAPLSDFYEFFKAMNESNENATEDMNSSDETDENINDDIDNEINQPITESEILKNVKLLKNHKSPGFDNIVNEHIKSTIHMLMPIYTKLFNLILDTGIIPESWTIGVIKPIYKNKGNPKAPENYRPITLLSCFGKLFTLIINNRLNKYCEEHNTINRCQAGFRKNHSTTDNLFILKSLIDILQSQHKKPFLLFR